MFQSRPVLWSIFIGLLITSLSYFVGFMFDWVTPENFNLLEAFAVLTSYSCTIMFVWQKRMAYLMGVITTAAYSILFYQYEWYALSLFNLYLVGSLAYGWYRWGPDDKTIEVTNLDAKSYPLYGLFTLSIVLLFLGIHSLMNYLNGLPVEFSSLNPIDVGLAAASGTAQLLLDNKKITNWFVWIAVNIVSIPFFFIGGAYIVAFQYVFFLGNAVYGYISWNNNRNLANA